MVLTSKLRSVWPSLRAFTLLQVLIPLSFITCSITVGVDTETMSLIISPLAIVHFTLCVSEGPLAVSSP